MWMLYAGDFDEAGAEYDHVVEHSDGGTNQIENLQALCPNCLVPKGARLRIYIRQSFCQD